MNKNTYRIRTASWWVTTHDKAFCKLVEKREPEPEQGPKFKAGDPVEVRRMVKWYPGVVLRRTPRGFSVRYNMGSKQKALLDKMTFCEGDIRERQPETG